MSKAFWWVVGVAGAIWLLARDESPSPSSSYSPTAASHYSGSSPAGVPGRYGYAPLNSGEEDAEPGDDAEEVRQAKQDFESAADDLRAAVNALQYSRWDGQMPIIRSRLEDADDALSQLEALRPGAPSVQNARDEVDRMRSHLARLHLENWRTVKPDLDTTSLAIEDEASSVVTDDDED